MWRRRKKQLTPQRQAISHSVYDRIPRAIRCVFCHRPRPLPPSLELFLSDLFEIHTLFLCRYLSKFCIVEGPLLGCSRRVFLAAEASPCFLLRIPFPVHRQLVAFFCWGRDLDRHLNSRLFYCRPTVGISSFIGDLFVMLKLV